MGAARPAPTAMPRRGALGASLALHGALAGAAVLPFLPVPMPRPSAPATLEVVWAPSAGPGGAPADDVAAASGPASETLEHAAAAEEAEATEPFPELAAAAETAEPQPAAAAPQAVAEAAPDAPAAEPVPEPLLQAAPEAPAAEPAPEPPPQAALQAAPQPTSEPPAPPAAPPRADPAPSAPAVRSAAPRLRPSPRADAALRRPPSRPAPPAEASGGTAARMPAGGVGGATMTAAPPPGSVLVTAPRYRLPPTPPVYPPRAVEFGLTGTVLLRARVSPDGSTEEIRVWRSSGQPLLDAAALAAVRRWAFEPASVDGRRVEAWVEVPVHFRLN